MEEFEPKIKKKTFTREFFSKYIYILVVGLCLLLGVSYGLTFFVHNENITTGSITTGALTINFTDRNINTSGLNVPLTDQEGLSLYSKSLTITNTTNIDGKVEVTLTRTSGLNLTDMRYALVVNGAIQIIADVPQNGEILNTAILGNEVMNVEVKLWPKTSYAGSATTFVGGLTADVRYFGSRASSTSNLTGKYVNFNCSGNNCELWQIVKVEDNRLVLTREANYSGATSRTNSNRYNPTEFGLTFNDDSLITSLSTDGLNVYLVRTAKISGGSGTSIDPYTLTNDILSEPDKKVQATITYKEKTVSSNSVSYVNCGLVQNIYYGETNYISQVLNKPFFIEWEEGNNSYSLGDVVNFTTDKVLNAVRRAQAIDVGYDDTHTNLSCDNLQCAITAVYNYRNN